MSDKCRFYLASPLFTTKEKERILNVSTYLRSLGYDVFSPMEHMVPNAWKMPNNEWGKAVFEMDLRELDACDKVIVIYDGLYSDTGTAWEVGYAYAKGKQIYVLCTRETEAGKEEKSVPVVDFSASTSLNAISIPTINCYNSKPVEASLMMVNGAYTTIYYDQLREYNFEKDEQIICDINQK